MQGILAMCDGDTAAGALGGMEDRLEGLVAQDMATMTGICLCKARSPLDILQ